MTTIIFKENLDLSNLNSISIYDFLDILIEKWFLPRLEKLKDNEITPEIMNDFINSKKSKNRINI